MAISGIVIDAVNQLPGEKKIRVDYTISGSDAINDKANVFLCYERETTPFGIIRVFDISGDVENQGHGSHILYWDNPKLEYGTFEGDLRILLLYIEI